MTALATRPRKATRLLAFAGASGLAILSLSACIKVDADLTVNADATGSGTFALEVQKEAAQFLGISDLSSFQSQLTEGELSSSGIGEFGTCEASESDTGFVYSCSFSDMAFTAEDGLWTVNKVDDSIVFHLANKGQSDTEGSDATALLGDSGFGDITIDVTFPGPITALTGSGAEKTSDTSATIKGTMTDNLDVTITSEASSGGFSPAALLTVLIGLAVLALIVIVIIVLLMRRRKGAAPAEMVAADTFVAEKEAAEVVGMQATVAPDMAAADDGAVVLDDVDAPTVFADAVPDAVDEPVTEALAPLTPEEPVAEPVTPADGAPDEQA